MDFFPRLRGQVTAAGRGATRNGANRTWTDAAIRSALRGSLSLRRSLPLGFDQDGIVDPAHQRARKCKIRVDPQG